MKKFLIALSISYSFGVMAEGTGSHGGDPMAFDFTLASASAINQSRLSIGTDITEEKFQELVNALKETKVFVTDNDLCKDDDCSTGIKFAVRNNSTTKVIEVNRTKWGALPWPEKLKIGLHEYLGIINVELDNYNTSVKLLQRTSAATPSLFKRDDVSKEYQVIPSNTKLGSVTYNRDNSVTFNDIQVIRGAYAYPISARDREYLGKDDKWATPTCRLLGFDSSLSGANQNDANVTRKMNTVVLSSEGHFNGTEITEYQVNQVTCYKSNYLKTIVDFDMLNNEDGSATITNIRLIRGSYMYPISARDGEYLGKDDKWATPTCRLLGFDSSLSGANQNDANVTRTLNMAELSSSGYFNKIEFSNYMVNQVTCYSGSEPALIVLVGGTRWKREF